MLDAAVTRGRVWRRLRQLPLRARVCAAALLCAASVPATAAIAAAVRGPGGGIPSTTRLLDVVASCVAVAIAVATVPELAFAQATMPGQQLLTFAKNFIIAPIALFAIVISGVAAFVRPDLIKTTGYIAIIAVILYFLLANADRLMQAIRAG